MEHSPDLFRGELVRLAAPRMADAEVMARWDEDAEYLRLLDTDFASPRTVEQYREESRAPSRRPNSLLFRIRTVAEDQLIGFVALHGIEWNNRSCMMAIGIGEPEYRGRGYGGDAIRLILGYAFRELNLERVGLDVISYNAAAIGAYERAGFVEEGRMRAAVLRDGQRYDRVIMGILRAEWQG